MPSSASLTCVVCDLQFILTPGGPVPGECLPLNGSKGEVVIHLREPIIPTAVTYEHVPSAITYDFRSAPRDITVVSALRDSSFMAIPHELQRLVRSAKT